MFENKNKTDRIVNIDKEKYENIYMYIRVMISYVRTYLLYEFRKIITNPLYTHNSYNCKTKRLYLIYSLHFYQFNQHSQRNTLCCK